ncbi:hypothetical protein GCM10009601_55570 [Streptomyces thermospinosisporus]|uniref:Peptidase S33 tripeptidyl aminopeptidase-like C-terminal domain-containing protein n=1 Tax=Streptomyces thermospinosisporus TaxID=161482 RepID=A0ABN1Z6S9_9ACTN
MPWSAPGWPVRGKAEHPDVRAPSAPPILLVGNIGDPATPYEGAARIAKQLGLRTHQPGQRLVGIGAVAALARMAEQLDRRVQTHLGVPAERIEERHLTGEQLETEGRTGEHLDDGRRGCSLPSIMQSEWEY